MLYTKRARLDARSIILCNFLVKASLLEYAHKKVPHKAVDYISAVTNMPFAIGIIDLERNRFWYINLWKAYLVLATLYSCSLMKDPFLDSSTPRY